MESYNMVAFCTGGLLGSYDKSMLNFMKYATLFSKVAVFFYIAPVMY